VIPEEDSEAEADTDDDFDPLSDLIEKIQNDEQMQKPGSCLNCKMKT